MRALLIDSEAGNLRSVFRALTALNILATIIESGAELLRARERILIFPGVGEARSVMASLRRRGLDSALKSFVAQGGALLGICVGAQLLLQHSQERDTTGLGIVAGTNTLLSAGYDRDGARIKIPHMGWNSVHARPATPLFAAIPQGSAFYFVHSYYTLPTVAAERVAWCEHGQRFPVAFMHARVCGVQFHPEKSGRHGLQFLSNFVRWAGRLQHAAEGVAGQSQRTTGRAAGTS